jgi:predicted O-linked N-acetylglucosamine transferase (SPINDLY family)
VNLERLGISRATHLLVSPGTPYKYSPESDICFTGIAQRVPNSRLVFFHHHHGRLSQRLERRLRTVFQKHHLDFDAHVTFVPWQSQEAFFGLLGQTDVMLDSPGFSGFNTAMQAVECGVPVVAYEGEFLRSRFASGILRSIGLDDCVASSAETYVDRVAELCRDGERLKSTRKRLADRRKALFGDTASVADFQKWIRDIAGSS